MPLVDDLDADVPAEILTRRKALGTITGATFAIAGLGTTITAVSYLRPNVLYEPPTRFKVGRPEDIPLGTLIVMPDQRLYVVHSAEGFVALSSVCTHLGCMTRYEKAQQSVFCPCHGSRFDQAGAVKEGPAPKPLARHKIELVDGELVVDIGESVADDFSLEA